MENATKPLNHRFIEVVEDLRKSKKIKNEADLAKRVGRSRSVISEYMTSTRPVSRAVGEKMKKLFGVDIFESDENEFNIKSTDSHLDTGRIMERLLRCESYNAVLFETVVNVLAQQTGKLASSISNELHEAISMASKRQLAELRRGQA